MGQPLSKTPMEEMLGVEIADYVPTGRTSIALMGFNCSVKRQWQKCWVLK
jgi:hypothetical protein